MASAAPAPSPPTSDEILLAILALLIDEREAHAQTRPNAVKTEILLADAGLPQRTIATMLGKQEAAVRMAISRAKAKTDKSPTKKVEPNGSSS
jgi:DNA-directed RNA polymerase specialized sigma24 family protein